MLRVALLGLASTLVIAAGPIPLGKLPAGVTPTAYRLDLTVDPSQPRYTGHGEIDATIATATDAVYLHGLGLDMARVSVRIGGKTVAAKYTEVDPSGVVRLDLASPLPVGKATFVFDYSTGFRSGAEGLFRAKVGDDWYAWTQMEPLDARRMFPSFDEPGFKTPFTVSLTVPGTVKAFANAPETSASTRGKMVTHRFAPTKPLPTYLVSVGVGPFDVRGVTIPANAVRKTPLDFRVIATKGQAPRMDIALAETPKLLGILEDYFGSPYPFEKLDIIASPVMGGAMENAGLILYADTLILLDKDAPFSQLRGFGEVSAHEMAHQWFGDLVTPTWWTDIWLNESFAEWMGKKAGQIWRPELGIGATELSDAFNAMGTDALGRGRPIRQEITRNDQVISAFDGITYQKGAQVVTMFENFVGPDVFRKGVQLHMNRYAYRNASAEDFFGSVAEAAKDPRVVPALRTFTDQTGVPVVSVTDGERGMALSQARYRPIGVAETAAQTWSIPMCLTRGEGRACTLFDAPKATLPPLIGTEAALMPNAEGAGYYRFSPASWDALIAAAPSLPGRDAMSVADSLWADFTAGKTGFDVVARGAKALVQNSERLAAVAIGYRLSGLANSVLTDSQRGQYQRMMASIYTPRLAALGFDPAPGAYAAEPVERAALRQSLLPLVANEARDPAVRAKLVAAAEAVLAGKADAVDPAYRAIALAVAVQDKGAPFMEALSKAMLASNDPLFRSHAAAAIGSAATPEQARTALQLALAPGMQSLETARLVLSVAGQPGARDAAVAFTESNFTRVMESFPGFSRASIIGIFNGYCSREAADRAEAMMRPKLAELGSGALELAQARDRILQCAALNDAKAADIAAELNGY